MIRSKNAEFLVFSLFSETEIEQFILSGKTTSFGRGQSELALPEGNKSIGGVME